eukprot:scaffold3054_cov129-Cylindrotheca_fusiformis.AAC.20
MANELATAKLESPPPTMKNQNGAETATTKEQETPTEPKQPTLKIAVGSSNPCKLDAVKQAFERVLNKKNSKNNNNNNDSATPPKVLCLELDGFTVDSGVSNQPFGDEETREGAKNRAKAAYHEFKTKHGEYPHLAIGLEGGLEWCSSSSSSSSMQPQEKEDNSDDDSDDDSDVEEEKEDDDTLWCMAWMAVYGKRRKFLVELLASEDSKFYTERQKPIYGLAKTATFLLPEEIAKMIKNKKMELGDADDKLFGRVNGKQGNGTVGILTDGLIVRAEYYEHALLLALVPWIRPDVYANSVEKPASAAAAASSSSTTTSSGGLLGSLICLSRNGSPILVSMSNGSKDLPCNASDLGSEAIDESLSTNGKAGPRTSESMMENLAIDFRPWDYNSGASDYVKQLDKKMVISTWGMMYCGGAKPVLKRPETDFRRVPAWPSR